MSLQRQHFHLSYFKTLSVGLAGFEPVTSRSADRCSPNKTNQVEGELAFMEEQYS